ncbi:hypothetical protein E2C01_039274 [Portunus trituberculatus]|uniref:Uncharacterized protein n=1 Tax=Portunus trituberculatus TaxID=210409 RepID=A0A5B7FEC4_PORTR|nr:hypothetical protein [Portunus trituberculatus]
MLGVRVRDGRSEAEFLGCGRDGWAELNVEINIKESKSLHSTVVSCGKAASFPTCMLMCPLRHRTHPLLALVAHTTFSSFLKYMWR